MRKIICTNEDNVSLNFGDTFSPFLLLNCDGIYSVDNNVSTSANIMIDGSTYLGTVTRMRNIVLTLADKNNHMFNRNLLYQLFKPKSPGTFTYIEDGDVKAIDYYVESISIDSVKRVRTATISLLCPDPFFKDLEDIKVLMAGWENGFIFPHEFIASGEALGTRLTEKLKEIPNESAADNIGITAILTAEGNVTNPGIFHVETNSIIKVGTTLKPLNLINGEKVIITTSTNNKNVYLESNGETTVINEYLDETSDFFQLQHGKNSLRYSADVGEDYLSVEIRFRYRYLGV